MDVIYGKNAILTLIEQNKRKVYKVYVNSEKKKNELNLENIEIKSNSFLDKISSKGSHQGYVAQVEDFKYGDINLLRKIIKSKKERVRLITLDKIQDPQNFGQIIRTAECFAIDAIIIPNKSNANVTSIVVKSSTGASEIVPIIKVVNLNKTCTELTKLSVWNIATDAKAEQNIEDIDKNLNYNLILGSEGFGISHILLKNSDMQVKIDLKGKINSLNVSAACAICLSILK